MPYMSVVGIDRQECQTAKADKDPKRQAGVPKERVKHHSPPLIPPLPFVSFVLSRGKINRFLTSRLSSGRVARQEATDEVPAP
jgi:hypothetical protein